MKKIFCLSILILLFSCTESTIENSVSNLTVEKSKEILQYHQDSVIIATNDNIYFYVIDNNEVKYILAIYGENSLNPQVTTGKLFLLVIVALLISPLILILLRT